MWPGKGCRLAGYTEPGFGIRFAVGPKWCFAAVGLNIRVLWAARPTGGTFNRVAPYPRHEGRPA